MIELQDMAETGSAGSTAKPEKNSAKRGPWRRFLERNVMPVPEERQKSPEYEAGFLSKLTFSWMGPLINVSPRALSDSDTASMLISLAFDQTGYRRPLKLNDIPLLNPSRSVQDHSVTFSTHFAAALAPDSGVKHPLFTALHRTFAHEFWLGGIYRLVADLCIVFGPYTLRYVIQFALDSYVAGDRPGSEPPPLGKGIGLLAGIILLQILLSVAHSHFMYSGCMVGGQVSALLTAQILEKSLKISERARAGGIATPAIEPGAVATPQDRDEPKKEAESEQGWDNGRVINLVTMDAHRIDQCIAMVHVVWTSPITILICMALLLVNLSYSALSGLGCLIFAMMILGIAIKSLFTRRQAINVTTDARVGLTQEALQAIRLVKYFSWEDSFVKRLASIRRQETRQLQGHMAIFNIVTALGQSLPTLAAMVSFVTFALGSGRELNPAVVFSSVALFGALLFPTAYLPGCLGQASDAWASLGKIEEYLLAEEVEEADVDRDMGDAVHIEQAQFTWEKSHQDAAADSALEIQEKKGSQLQSKSSKSQITLALTLGGGTLVDEPTVPEPFILPSFSLDIRRGELLAVIGGIGCGKTSLLSALAGDMRKVHGTLKFASERAFCPQTAWIQNATVRDNILFGKPYEPEWYDTVVTACQLRRDMEILPNGDATEIGERGINLSGGQKQRVSLARAVYSKAEILLLDDPLSAVDPYVGRAIFEKAILGVLQKRTRVLATHQTHVLSRCDRILWLENGRVKAVGSFKELKERYPDFVDLVREAEGSRGDEKSAKDAKRKSLAVQPKEEAAALEKLAGDDTLPVMMGAEEQAVDGIPWAVYHNYIASSRSRIPVVLAIPLLVLAQGGNLLCGLWLAWWASDRFGLPRNTYVAVYVTIAVAQGLMLYLFGLCVGISGTSSSNVMLDRATEGVMRAPIWFFDTTPLGRITNRFSKDIDVMDEALPEALRLFLVFLALVLGIFALILAYFHWFAVTLGPCIVILFLSAAYYRVSAREIKRHEAVLRGVVVARFSETLDGVTTIRTYSMQSWFARSLQVAIDNMNSANFLTISNQRWLAIRLDFVGIILIITSGVLVLVDRFTQSPAISGLVMNYALGALQVLQFLVRQWANVENAMNATERIHAYGSGTSLPVEGQNGKPAVPARPSWPEKGAITFSNVHMRYRPDLPEVLRGLDLTVRPGEHVAIVGRTGAGKSSLISALFRVCELSEGSISIDGVDISQLPLRDIRTRISIQPQESILFRGSVRTNLDPFQEHSDEELWLALRGAWLADTVHLDDTVQEEGSNFSHGQRQQLGLARLLVRGSRVVVCDEATSSVDLETDDKIQRTMVQAFMRKTVLTVAHRIRTIIFYDRVCVMERGRIAELGTPRELWDLGGVFKGMCETSGISREELGGPL
jgi:ABC-type multidrug transport system fused ATPase/permease subunit